MSEIDEDNDLFDFAVKTLAASRLSDYSRRMLQTRRQIEKDFDSWLINMNPRDPENVEILQRVRYFDIKVRSWKDFGKLNDLERSKALDFL